MYVSSIHSIASAYRNRTILPYSKKIHKIRWNYYFKAFLLHKRKRNSHLYFSFHFFIYCSGLDVVAILDYLGLNSPGSVISNNNVATGASTFVVAYAVHKVFAPFRISITLISAPFIVRYLRNKGILSAKPKSAKKWSIPIRLNFQETFIHKKKFKKINYFMFL